jgi:RNA polymerase sigma factor (sigma-70 family)
MPAILVGMSRPEANLSDDDLVRLARTRSSSERPRAQSAFAELYRRWAGRLAAFLARRLPRDDVDDALHDLWLRIWDRLPAAFQAGQFSAWLFTVTRHWLVDRNRGLRLRQTTALPVEVNDPRQSSPDDRLIDEEHRQQLADCLQHLDETSRALLAGLLGGERYAELCPRLGLTPSQAHKRKFDALARLRRCVQEAIS